jgi:hypothetical protein
MYRIHWLAELLTDLIGHFNNKDKATVVILLMLGLCLALGGWLYWHHRAFKGAINSAADAVRTALSTVGTSAGDRLNAVSSTLATNTAVRFAWEQYHGSLREDPRLEGAFVNLVDPHAWFAPERLKGHGYEKWITTFASVSLCVGLLFTFVGLSAALMQVSNVDDAALLRVAINGILTVSSAKFLTSIFGILLFIVWTVVGRCVASGQRHAAAGLADEVQRLSTLMTPEVLLMDQLLAAREQTLRMKTLADDVAVAFEARLTDVVGRRLDAFPAQMGESIRPVVEAIEGMGGSLSKGADNAMARVAERLEQAAETIQAAQGGFGSSGDAFGSSISRASVTMTESVTHMAETIDSRLAGLEARIVHVDEALTNGAQTITGVSQGLSAATSAALEQALATISEQAARGADQAREQSQAALQPLFQSLASLAEQIREQASKGSGHLVDGGKSAAELLAAAAQGIGDRLGAATGEASAKLEGAANAMAARMDAAVGQFQQLERAIAAHVGHLQRTGEAITTAGTNFGVAATQLRQTAEPIRTTLSSVEASARQAADALKSASQVQDGIRDASAKLSDVSRSASQAFESYRERFATTDDALGRTFEKLVGGVRDLSSETNTVVADMEKHLASAVGLLRAGIEDIAETVGNMQTTADRLEGVMTRRAGVAGHP